ncbi:MAG TPA: SGNH/GDSL hydrolase family protein [Gammaproteobacteria bacterium]|nr:SGNH/GDSL hydrolase family protein [Gammaproteobacteria bacterium]
MNPSTRFNSVLLVLAAFLPVCANADTYSRVVAFGDSLTDTGNKFVITGLSNTPPYDLLDAFRVPDGPYATGGLHYSNNAIWLEDFARPLGLGGTVRPALRKPGKASNYAYGGARARAGSPEPDLVQQGCLSANNNLHFPQQVTAFLGDTNYSAPEDALYALFIGGNDVTDAVRVLQCDPTGLTSVQVIVGGALTSVGNHMVALYQAGARKFLVLNSPDIGLIPSFNPPLNTIPGAAQAATCFSLLYNFGTLAGSPVPPECGFPPGIPGLGDALNNVAALYPDIEIVTVDIYSEFVQLVTAPLETEPQNGTDTCIMPDVPPYKCKDPDNYVFWDGVHPTKRTHELISDLVSMTLGN